MVRILVVAHGSAGQHEWLQYRDGHVEPTMVDHAAVMRYASSDGKSYM